MGAGASINEAKLSDWKEKLLNLDNLKQNQRDALLSQMSRELIKLQPVNEEDKAAAKIQALQRKNSSQPVSAAGDMGSGDSLEELFKAFCATYRQTEMTNTVFAKFCKDSKLLDKKFTKPDIDMVWSSAAGKDKKVGLPKFIKLLEGVAKKKSVEYAEVETFVLENAKVSSSGTKGKSRFYDDKSSWTGAAVNGGPTNDDKSMNLAGMCERK